MSVAWQAHLVGTAIVAKCCSYGLAVGQQPRLNFMAGSNGNATPTWPAAEFRHRYAVCIGAALNPSLKASTAHIGMYKDHIVSLPKIACFLRNLLDGSTCHSKFHCRSIGDFYYLSTLACYDFSNYTRQKNLEL